VAAQRKLLAQLQKAGSDLEGQLLRPVVGQLADARRELCDVQAAWSLIQQQQQQQQQAQKQAQAQGWQGQQQQGQATAGPQHVAAEPVGRQQGGDGASGSGGPSSALADSGVLAGAKAAMEAAELVELAGQVAGDLQQALLRYVPLITLTAAAMLGRNKHVNALM
jgi:hypothetical protein